MLNHMVKYCHSLYQCKQNLMIWARKPGSRGSASHAQLRITSLRVRRRIARERVPRTIADHVPSRETPDRAVATVFFFKKNKVTRVAQRYAACQKKSGITRFARPSALIPFFSGTPLGR
jgi:hypothetical protein